GVVGDGVVVEGYPQAVEHAGGIAAGQVLVDGAEVDEEQVVVGPAGDDPHPFVHHRLGHRLGVGDDLVGVGGALGLGGLVEAHGLGGDLALDRAALAAGEHRLVDDLGVPLPREDHAAPRAPERLVGGGGDDVGVLERVGQGLSGDQADEVGGVHQEDGLHLVG